ncbi:TetR/AcrR family transcriptional regulator [Nocardioides sp. CPCC 206347]|uniref:TetR/AcrR family transcriptional regulator n=1 Tax=unclassified Nocardioides TaxID=2615069 RepID=UPI003613DCB5
MTKGDRTRQRILEVVTDLLEAESYDRISIAEITRRAEITRPAFYFHFPNKGAVLGAALDELRDEFIAVATAWYDHAGGDPAAGIPEALDATIALWRSHARLLDAVVRASAADAEAADLMASWVEELTARAADRLRRDVGPELGLEGLSVEALAEFMVGATVEAMRRDVRRIVESGVPTPGISATLTFVWARVVAPAPRT